MEEIELEQNEEVNKEAETGYGNLVPALEEGVIEGTKGLLLPLRVRLKNREKKLKELTATKHTKYMRGTIADWKDTPSKFQLGHISPTMNGSVGEIDYVVYMKDPKTGNKVHSIGGGGPILQFYVKEKFVEHRPATQEVVEAEGVPSLNEALSALKDEREAEKRKRESR